MLKTANVEPAEAACSMLWPGSCLGFQAESLHGKHFIEMWEGSLISVSTLYIKSQELLLQDRMLSLLLGGGLSWSHYCLVCAACCGFRAHQGLRDSMFCDEWEHLLSTWDMMFSNGSVSSSCRFELGFYLFSLQVCSIVCELFLIGNVLWKEHSHTFINFVLFIIAGNADPCKIMVSRRLRCLIFRFRI